MAHFLNRLFTNKIIDDIDIVDILVINKNGLPISTKENIFGSTALSAGLISAIQSFSTTLTGNQTNSFIKMNEHAIYVKSVEEFTLALITRSEATEKIGFSILDALAEKLKKEQYENIEVSIKNFLMEKTKGII